MRKAGKEEKYREGKRTALVPSFLLSSWP